MHPTEGLTQTHVDQSPGHFNTYGSTERAQPIVFCAQNVVFPATAGDYLLFEMGGSGVGSSVYLTAAGDMVARCADGGALPNAAAAVASGSAAAYLGATADVTWEFDPVGNTARLWIGEDLIGEGVAGVGFSDWAGSNNAGYGTFQGSLPADSPTTDWPGYDSVTPADTPTLGALKAFSNQLSTWADEGGGAGTSIEVAPARGAQSVAGRAVDVWAISTISPERVALAFVGVSSGVAGNLNVLPDRGAMLFTGQQPDVGAGSGVTLAPGISSLILSGFSPEAQVATPVLVTPSRGLLSTLGSRPTVEAGSVLYPSGATLDLFGLLPGVVASMSVEVAPDRTTFHVVGFRPGAIVFERTRRLSTRRKEAAIPVFTGDSRDTSGLKRVLQAMKERIEVYGRDRGDVAQSMVRVQDLVDLGLITQDDVLKLRRKA